MGLSSIRGQDRAIGTLGHAMKQGRLHHAYRFEGPGGVGKELTALCVARLLNCETPGIHEIRTEGHETVAVPDFCARCRSCRKIEAGNHPDVKLLFAEKGKASISIAQIRELFGFVVYPPSEGKVKAIIVRDADRITEEAANALLKMLEEPPPRTHFFLVTARPHSMLHTITSRSVPVRFAPLGPADMKAVLAGIVGVEQEPGQLDAVIALSGGSVSSALSHLSAEWAEVIELVVRMDEAFDRGTAAMVTLLDDVAISRASAETLLTFLEMFYRDVAWLGVTGDPEGLMLHSIEPQITARARTLSARRASAMALRLPEHRALLQGYVNPRMVLERLHMELGKELG